jgi:hypothetical protein
MMELARVVSKYFEDIILAKCHYAARILTRRSDLFAINTLISSNLEEEATRIRPGRV